MEHRISAGGIVTHQNKVLLVHHFREDEFDFWVLPGGGVEGTEGILKAVEREVFEETNLKVNAEKIAYVEDFIDEGKYVCKFWVCCSLHNIRIDLGNIQEAESFLIEAGFFSKDEILMMNVYPEMLKNQFWDDLGQGFPHIRYLGMSA